MLLTLCVVNYLAQLCLALNGINVHRVDKVLGLHFSIPSVLLACGLCSALAVLEYLFPWNTEVSS